MISEHDVGRRVKDAAGHFGQAVAYRPQPRCPQGDAVHVRWESAERGDSWEYAAALEIGRDFSPRPGARKEAE